MSSLPRFKFIVLVLIFELLLSPVNNVFAKQYSEEVIALLAKGDEYLVNQDKPDEAARYYEKAIKIDNQCPHAHNQLGLCYSHLGKLPEAISEFKEALEIDPKFIPSLVNLGSAYYRSYKYSQALEYYKKASSLRKDKDPEILANMATTLRDRAAYDKDSQPDKDYAEAELLYKKAIQLNSNFAQAHNNYALLLLAKKRYAEARKEVNQAIAIKNNYAMAYYNLGLIEEDDRQIQKAIKAYRLSLQYETDPNYKEETRRKILALGGSLTAAGSDVITKSYSLILKKQWQEAESLLSRITTGKESSNPIAWNNYGFVLAHLGKSDQALEAYKKAAMLLPSHFPAVHYNMGQLLMSCNDLAGAKKSLQEAITQANGGHALAHNALAIVLKQQGDLKRAMEHYNLAISQSGNALPVVHFNRAILLEKEGFADDAAIEYKIYLDSAPDGFNAQTARLKLKQLN